MTVLPHPPRPIRLRTALSLWWPLGLTVVAAWLALTVIGLLMLAQDGFRLPTRDLQLDGNAQTVADAAEVTAIESTGTHMGGRQLEQVHYRALVDGRDYRGSSFAWAGAFKVGMHAALDMLPEDHQVQRLNGSMAAVSSAWMPWFAGWIWLPLCVLIGFWLTRAYRLRVFLRNGPEAAAELLEASPRRYVNPPQLYVRYRFTADDGQHLEGWQWLRLNSPLAQRLQGLPLPAVVPDAAVVYEELVPVRNRLLGKEQLDEA